MFNADDDDFFTPTSASNLAHLFGINQQNDLNNIDTSLTYMALKEPSNKDQKPFAEAQNCKATNKLISVKTIQLHKMHDSSYLLLGKYGIAIIGDVILNLYQLIVYKTKQNILSITKINEGFTYTQHKCNMASFKDDKNQAWVVNFDNSEDCIEFTNELKHRGVKIDYRDNCDGFANVKNVLMAEKVEHNVSFGESNDNEDNLNACARADILERISKVGQSILPASNIKSTDLSESEADEVIQTKKIIRKPKRHSSSDKDMISVHSVDIQEPNKQFMLPIPVQSSIHQQYTLVNGQYIPNQMIQCLPTQMMSLNDPLNIYFAENRTHNSEVRINLSQLSNKLESVLSEIHNISNPPLRKVENDLYEKIGELERKIEIMNAQNDKNDKLRSQKDVKLRNDQDDGSIRNVNDYKTQLDNLNMQLHDSENKIIDLNKTIEAQNATICKYEDENKNLSETVNKLHDTIETNSRSLKDSDPLSEQNWINQNLVQKIQNELAQKNKDIIKLHESKSHQIGELLNEKSKCEAKLTELEQQVENLKLKLSDYEEYYKTNEETKDKLQKGIIHDENIKAFADVVKQCMNTMYQNILEKFDDDDFKKVLMHNMKNATFRIIQEYKSSVFIGEGYNKNDAAPPPIPEFEVTV